MEDILVLYDKEDVIEFNQSKKNFDKVFLFSPGLEMLIKQNKNLKIYKPLKNSDSSLQKKILVNSKKIYQEFEKNSHLLNNVDKGIIENIHNIFFVSVFSFMYLIECLKNYKSFKLIYNKKYYKFSNFESFIPLFLEKIFNKKNQDFFYYLRSTKVSKFKGILIKINNKICKFGKKKENEIISGSLLTKKIFLKSNKKEVSIFELRPYLNFKFYHILLNLMSLCNFFKKKKIFYLFPEHNNFSINNDLNNDLNFFFKKFDDENFNYFKKVICGSLVKYCKNQISFYKSVSNLVTFINPKYVFVDQLRFDISTILASICFSTKKNVVLVPHGSISIPEDEFSNFVLPICARGLIFSKIANYSVAQSKISYEAIKYYDQNMKILKSKPILFGQNFLVKDMKKQNIFKFLHASTPKSLSKWPWIYENYNEYIDNINELIGHLKNLKNVELIIRFREGPECDLETFKKLIKIDQNKFVKISSNKDFFDDLGKSNCLISFSSTSIEEALFLNQKVLIYSNSRKYKHINYKFENDNEIIYANQKNIDKKLKMIINNDKIINYKVLWKDEISKNESLKELY